MPAADSFAIVEDDLTDAAVAALLRFHLDEMRRNSPACSVHAMPIDRLRAPDVTFWTAWDGAALAGCGALKALGGGHGELKSMRTAPGFLRRGVGTALLDHLIGEARRRGYTRLSLETGSTAPFAAALALYAGRGFATCGPFGDYGDDPFLRFMTLPL